MKKQEKNIIENLDNFKEKFEKIGIKLEDLIKERENFIEFINSKKEKIEKKEDFTFSTFFVDGSMAKFGTKFPNYLYIFRSYSFSPQKNIKIYYYDVFSPLLEEDIGYFNEKLEGLIFKNKKPSLLDLFYVEEKLRYEFMAKLEICAGLKSLEYLKEGDILFMDGSLTHLEGEVPSLFNKLKKESLNKKITIVGIIEDIGSSELGEIGDKEILTGNIGKGEMIFLETPEKKKDYSIVYLRTSIDPTPISFDIFFENRNRYKEIASFIYFITFKNGRGVPIFKDLAHKFANLSEKEAFLIAKNFLNQKSFEIIFKEKRGLR
ncbi:MAG: DNA double-strand break repair nuclease NurA [Caldisericia bacterium]